MSGPVAPESASGPTAVASKGSATHNFQPVGAPPSATQAFLQKVKPSNNTLRQAAIMCITMVAIFQAGRSIVGSVQRQCYLNKQANVLKDGQKQAEEINKELRDGLTSYRSSTGIERLARERLNLAGPDVVVIRIGK